jgi:8-oxo-dGTP pyrophosphatase MutT (NUDIX family)
MPFVVTLQSMTLNSVSFFQNLLNQELPGEDAHITMSSPYRGRYSKQQIEKFLPKTSAVLLLFHQLSNEWHIVLTERKKYEGVHSGQISFPGGRQEHNESFLETALRETKEEIGVDTHKFSIVGNLTELYVPPSNFIIYPFVAYSLEKLNFQKEDKEVEEIINVPISFFLDDSNRTFQKVKVAQNMMIEVPAFVYQERVIWGATAAILAEILHLIKQTKS